MRLKQRLERLRYFDQFLTSKKYEIEQLRSQVYRVSKFLSENERRECTDELYTKIIVGTDNIGKEILAMFEERFALVEMINELEDPIKSLTLRMYYLDVKDWYIISRKLGYSQRHLQRIRDEAIEELEKM